MLKEEEKREIIEMLNQRVGHFSCPICHKGHFSLIDGYSSNVLGDNYHVINLEGRILPYVMLVCDNCGFISSHALGSLGILKRQEESNLPDEIVEEK